MVISLDPKYATDNRVDFDNEQAFEITEFMVQSDTFDIIFVDSLATLTPKVEIHGDIGHNHGGENEKPTAFNR